MADEAVNLPPKNGDLRFILIDSYSGSSGRLDGRSIGRSTPLGKWQFEINTDRLQLWQFRQTRWQIKWQIYYPPRKWQFEIQTGRLLLWELRQTRWQIKWQIYPTENGNLRFILIDYYSKRSGRWGGRSTPSQKSGNLRFILIECYSESSDRPGGRSSGRSTPLKL